LVRFQAVLLVFIYDKCSKEFALTTELTTQPNPPLEGVLITVNAETIRNRVAEFETITAITNVIDYDVAKKAKRECVSFRTAIETERKALKKTATERIDRAAEALAALAAPTEARLTGLITEYETAEAQAKEKKLDDRFEERVKRLDAIGGSQIDGPVRTMSESDFGQFLIRVAENNRLRREAEENQKAINEQNRQAAERLAEERRKLEQERFDLEAEQRRLAAERKAIDDAKQAEEQAKIAANLEAARVAANAEEAKRKEALLPYAERLHVFAAQVEHLQPPHDMGKSDVLLALSDCACSIRRIANGL
jgi:hypothetical protein